MAKLLLRDLNTGTRYDTFINTQYVICAINRSQNEPIYVSQLYMLGIHIHVISDSSLGGTIINRCVLYNRNHLITPQWMYMYRIII